MNTDLNTWAILVATLATMAVGFAWYSELLFGRIWMREMHLHKIEKDNKKMGVTLAVAFLVNLIMVYVLAHFVSYMNADMPSEGAETAFWLWLGFMVPLLVGNVLWERKSLKLLVINAAHWLLVLVLSGVILAVWQ